MVLPIKFQSSMKDENFSCVKSIRFTGYTSKTAKQITASFEIEFDGSMRGGVRKQLRRDSRVDVQQVQDYFNEFEIHEKVRNSRDCSEKSYTKLGEKQRALIDRGKVIKKKYELPERWHGIKFVEAKYFTYLLMQGARRQTICMSEKGFEFAWQGFLNIVKQTDLIL